MLRTTPPEFACIATVACLAIGAWACGAGDTTGDRPGAEPRIAVLSAFPAEMAAILDRTDIESTRVVSGVTIRFGRLGGARVAVAMTGIGLANARATTRTVLDAVAPSGLVVSAVAGSTLLVGDVIVPRAWRFGEDPSDFEVEATWLDLAATSAAAGEVVLENCAIVPESPPFDAARPGDRVCLPSRPRVVVGGVGSSGDPYGAAPFACQPGSDDVFGCDTTEPQPFRGVSAGDASVAALVRADADADVAVDMETAAIAEEAVARGVPFIAFRAASDGSGDPLGLAAYSQFFAYYRLASHNAAAATEAFLARLARSRGADPEAHP